MIGGFTRNEFEISIKNCELKLFFLSKSVSAFFFLSRKLLEKKNRRTHVFPYSFHTQSVIFSYKSLNFIVENPFSRKKNLKKCINPYHVNEFSIVLHRYSFHRRFSDG